MSKAVQNSHSEDVTLRDIFKIFSLYRKALGFFLCVGLAGACLFHALYPSYKASVSVAYSQRQDSPLQAVYANLAAIEHTGEAAEALQRYTRILDTRSFFVTLAKALLENKENAELKKMFCGSDAVENSEVNTLHVALQLRQAFKYELGLDNVMVLSATTPKAELSYKLANFFAENAVQVFRSADSVEIEAGEKYIGDQYQSVADNLRKLAEEKDQIMQRYNLSMGPGGLDSAEIARSTTLSGELQENEFLIQEKKIQILDLNRKQAKEDMALSDQHQATTIDATFSRKLRRQIKALRDRKAQLLVSGYSIDSDEVKFLDQEIAKRTVLFRSHPDTNVDDEEDSSTQAQAGGSKMNQARQSVQTLVARNHVLHNLVDEVRKVEQEKLIGARQVLEINRKMDVKEQLVRELQKKLFEMGIQKISSDTRFVTLDSATAYTVNETLPFSKKLALCLLLALMLGTIFIFVIESTFPSVRGRDDLNNLGLAVVGSLPMAGSLSKKRTTGSGALAFKAWDAPVELAFRHMASRLLAMGGTGEDAFKTFSVVSPESGDGKSFVTVNLARILARMGHRTLLIDCDVRRPGIAKAFALETNSGFSDLLRTGHFDAQFIHKAVESNLDVLPSGAYSESVSELMLGDKLKTLIAEFRKRYDFVVIDTPPLLAAVDSVVLADLSDCTVVVTSQHKTKLANLISGLERLSDSEHQKRLAGVINKSSDRNQFLYIVTNSLDSTQGERRQSDRRQAA